ncbi:MAG: preprotein translocase subunit SecG [Candidatus Omnitrophica bacterium]|nr:preprotein translocase subunit SecG [Candidatus Omnitrophota bacterium]
MLYGVVIAFHVVACLVLILVILLQAGRGGGLSESFTGQMSQTLFGTKANVFLTRSTTVCAIVFMLTCVSLNIMTSRRGRSLMEFERAVQNAKNMPLPVTAPQGQEKMTLDQAKKELPPVQPEKAPTK